MIGLPSNSKIRQQVKLHQLVMFILGFDIDGNDVVEEKGGEGRDLVSYRFC